jgi:hypothetical protein
MTLFDNLDRIVQRIRGSPQRFNLRAPAAECQDLDWEGNNHAHAHTAVALHSDQVPSPDVEVSQNKTKSKIHLLLEL